MGKLLALDQSSKVTGIAIYEDGVLTKCSKIDLTNPNLAQRLVDLRNQIKSLIENEKITEVIIEDIQLQNNVVNNVETYRALAEVRGVLEEFFAEMHIPYSIVLASSWKSKLGIKGANRTAQKQAAQKYVFEKHGIKAIQDICDAICIGDYHLANLDGFDWAD